MYLSNNKRTWATIIISFLGFLDAAYLSAKFFLGGTIPCAIVSGCDYVTRSEYATIFHISVALIGVIYYLAVLVLVLFYFDSKKQIAMQMAGGLVSIGFLMSVRFLYIQLFSLRALCAYCLFSLLTSTALFLLLLPFTSSGLVRLARSRGNKLKLD